MSDLGRTDVLFITHRTPYPPDKGDRIRTLHILRYLARFSRVHLATLTDEPVDPEAISVLGRLCARVAVFPVGRSRWAASLGSLLCGRSASEGAFRSAALAATVRSWSLATPFGAAVASASSVAHYLREPALETALKVVDVVDVDSQKWDDYSAFAAGPKAWLYALEARRVRRAEGTIGQWADAVTLVSRGEANTFRKLTGAANVHAVTNGVDLDYFEPAAAGLENGCTFVGAMDYKPNADAACWFARSVWPHVYRRWPEANFTIVGRKPTRAVMALAALPGVEVVGQVPDVRPYLAGSAIAVAPLRFARGLQNKVLEAMASGKPVVASRPALAGFAGRPDMPARCATEVEEWVDEIDRLLGDEAERRRLGAAGRQYVETYHHWDACLEPLGRLLRLSPGPALAGGTV